MSESPGDYEAPPSAASEPGSSSSMPSMYRGWPGSPIVPYHMMHHFPPPPAYPIHWAAAPTPGSSGGPPGGYPYPPHVMMMNPHMMPPYPPMHMMHAPPPPPHDHHYPKNHSMEHLLQEASSPYRKDGTPTKSSGPYRTGRWTLDEKLLFLYSLRKFGRGKWKLTSQYLPQR